MACKCENCGGKLTGLAHIGIQVTDLAEAMDFYVGKLGFTLTNQTKIGDMTLTFIEVGSCKLELIHHPSYTPRPAGVIDHIAIEVDDIDTVVCRLTEQRIHFLSGEISTMPDLLGGVKNIFFDGPGGIRFEFFQYLK